MRATLSGGRRIINPGEPVAFFEGEATRLLGTPEGDRTLCRKHANQRVKDGQSLGIPGAAGTMMFGMARFPTGQEPCDDCGGSK